MKKTIKISESQLKMLREQSQEQRNGEGDFSSLQTSISDYMNSNHQGFENEKDLLSSISVRLSNAINMKNWGDVNDVNSDIKSFMDKSYKSKEDVPSIGDQSSVMDETPEESDERNYGVNESIEKLKSTFKRIV